MRKLLLTHYLYVTLFILLITLVRQYFSLSYYTLWLGAALGTILPDIDHFIYVYLLRPQELTSQRTASLISQNNIGKALNLLAITRTERQNLVFHNAMFQGLFVVFAYFVTTSTVSLFGKGLVLAFLLHLAIDQVIDLVQKGNIDQWFSRFKFVLNKQQQTIYWLVNVIIIFILGLFF